MNTIENGQLAEESKEYVKIQIQTIINFKKENQNKTWTQPAELNGILDKWSYFDEETKSYILIAIPEMATYLLNQKLSSL
jgi:hypothetical protein